jgi:hypothetical protein
MEKAPVLGEPGPPGPLERQDSRQALGGANGPGPNQGAVEVRPGPRLPNESRGQNRQASGTAVKSQLKRPSRGWTRDEGRFSFDRGAGHAHFPEGKCIGMREMSRAT